MKPKYDSAQGRPVPGDFRILVGKLGNGSLSSAMDNFRGWGDALVSDEWLTGVLLHISLLKPRI
uniref:Uncharacterized protein n=1 Tax=Romanomermis culicivorax TaxID=13658 RepID=A0A915JDE2_ROMCU